MKKHFFVSIFRNILHNRVFTAINLFNLVVGFAVFILFSVVINYDLDYDKFNVNYDDVYRVQTRQEDSYPINYCTYSPAAFRYHLMQDVPEVDKLLLMREVSGGAHGAGQFFTLPDGSQLNELDGYWSENSVFDIFSVQLLEGDKRNALTEPNTIALSQTLSDKLFPQGNAVGQQVTIGKYYLLSVSAVYADFPQNSSLRPTYMVSMPTYPILSGEPNFYENWTAIEFDNFVLLKNGADPALVEAKIKNAFAHVKNFEKSFPYLHPMSKWHLSPNSQPDMIVGLGILSLAAILVLILASVNYVNLSLANSTQRSTEIGIKKVIGSSKRMIAAQFMAETILQVLVATLLGLLVAQAFFPVLNRILNKNLDLTLWTNGPLLGFIFLVSLVVGVLSGLYPSLVISSYSPVKVLKGKIFSNVGKAFSIKKVLVAAQFSISLFMLIVSFILFNHVDFILNKDLGFDSKNILYTEINVHNPVRFETIRNRFLQHPEITDASFSSTIPFVGNIGGYVSWEGAAPDEREMVSRNYVNYDFIPTYNLKLVYGRNFSEDYPADRQACIINETALKVFGWDDPIGKRVNFYGRFYPVIGVVKDFHPFSVHNPIPTYVFFLNSDVISSSSLISVRFTDGNEQQAKAIVSRELESILPNDPFEFKDFGVAFYLDQAIGFWQSMKRMFLFFAVVTLIISTIGLFGLILFTVDRRTKEIGVRKVLGSSVLSVYWQLSSEVIRMLGVAILVGCPAAWYIYKAMPGAYKEPLSAMVFVTGIVLIAVIAQLTISYHVLKVAVRNPVEALRYE
ncbi:ABC transporter permease [Mangrovibacterium diazotrophicum]|uniref:Putative ABC transport system permease protein n=1 Tax=Mangrovibacterium diazotrophicum TaxID=1261403 RepID=A0A419W9D2_9BACT|nr:ABC transporter permease [Mangrovibacterium diazotrophicum]RKD92060.1 putative ABC transport system permease protein [Mangrovibacterium diazotrophicum]